LRVVRFDGVSVEGGGGEKSEGWERVATIVAKVELC
jgi:hypothetical protein